MNIYPSTKALPYVYMGIHKITGQIYIGYREINSNPSHIDLFNYRTSSNIVKPHFDDYDWHIIAEFFKGDAAYDFEQELIFKNWSNPLLLNKNCHHGKRRFKASKGISKPEGFGAMVRERQLGKLKGPQSEQHRKKISNSLTGKPGSDEKRKNCSTGQLQRFKETPESEITKKRKSDSHKGSYRIVSPNGKVWETDIGLKEFAETFKDEINVGYWQLFNAYRRCYNNTIVVRKRKDNNNWQVTRIDKPNN